MAEVESHDNDSRNRRTERQQLMRELSGLAMSIEPYDPKKEQQESYCWGNFDFDCGRVKEYLEQTYGEVQDSLKPTLYEICQEAFKVIDEFLKWALNDEQNMAIFVQLEGRWDTVVRKFDMCMRQQEKPAETGGNAKRVIAATIVSLMLILLFELFVYFGPVTWFRNHPRTYGIQGSIVCLITCLIFGFLKPRWRKWCWRTAAIAFLVGLLTLL